ncbi:hypothetical protein M5K25_016701 [Dendrobium thyrsiflorum]|uniref:Uncharacterized protein n=1 Tax=Dendrobium thyrsiflorum TaxID=117978 RepID=A0ABD0UKE7_DENTH
MERIISMDESSKKLLSSAERFIVPSENQKLRSLLDFKVNPMEMTTMHSITTSQRYSYRAQDSKVIREWESCSQDLPTKIADDFRWDNGEVPAVIDTNGNVGDGLVLYVYTDMD